MRPFNKNSYELFMDDDPWDRLHFRFFIPLFCDTLFRFEPFVGAFSKQIHEFISDTVADSAYTHVH